MKETVKVNLGQRLFDLDMDAYEVLKKYLDSLKRYFKKSPAEADEILQDIEQRLLDINPHPFHGGNSGIHLNLKNLVILVRHRPDRIRDLTNKYRNRKTAHLHFFG